MSKQKQLTLKGKEMAMYKAVCFLLSNNLAVSQNSVAKMIKSDSSLVRYHAKKYKVLKV